MWEAQGNTQVVRASTSCTFLPTPCKIGELGFDQEPLSTIKQVPNDIQALIHCRGLAPSVALFADTSFDVVKVTPYLK